MHSYTIRGEKEEEEVEDNRNSQVGWRKLKYEILFFFVSTWNFEKGNWKWDNLWDLEIKNSSNKCDIPWVGGRSGGFFFFFLIKSGV